MKALEENLPILYNLLDDRFNTGKLPHFGSWVMSKENGQDYVIGFRSGKEGMYLNNITPIRITQRNHHRGGYVQTGDTEEIELFLSRENLDKWVEKGKDGYSINSQC